MVISPIKSSPHLYTTLDEREKICLPFKKIFSPVGLYLVSESVSIKKDYLKSPLANISNIMKSTTGKSTPRRSTCKTRKRLNFQETQINDVPTDSVQADIKETIEILNEVVSQGQFSIDNIGYKIFKDTLKWHSSGNTFGMRYSQETKECY